MNTVKQNGHNPPENQPTSASEWRKARSEGYLITLPSGNKAKIKSVALDQLIQKGDIPDFLSPVAAKSLWAENDSNTLGEDENLSTKFIQLIDFIVPLALVEPKVVISPKEGREEISIEDIDFYDKVAIFNLSIQSSSVLKSFRDQQEKSLAGLSDSEDNEQSS